MHFVLKKRGGGGEGGQNLNFAYMMIGSEAVIITQEKHLEVRKVTFIQLLARCSLAIKKKKGKRIENRTENIIMPLHESIK